MNEKNKSNISLIMAAIFIATFMTSVEVTIITTALPTIISKLNGLAMQSWVFAMYLLTTAVSTPIYGKLSDRIGRKPIFVTGLVIFSLGSFLCGISPNIYWLIFFRAIQGIGAGAIMPITFTIIADLFSYKKRAKMLALNNTAWGISALMGPIIGGIIVDQLNWHWIFFINVPLGILVLVFVLIGLHEDPHKSDNASLDIKGIVGLSVVLMALLMLFQNIGAAKVNYLLIVVLAIVFIGSLVAFINVEKSAKDPIIPLSLFKNQLFTVQILTALLLSGAQIGFQTYFPIWLQSIYKVSASVAGLAVTPSPVMWLVTSFFVGSLVKNFAPKKIVLPIATVLFVTYIPLVFANLSFPMFAFYVIAGITGGCLGIVITMNILISQQVVPQKDIGTASATVTLGRTLGQTIMTGIFGLLFNLSINHSLVQNKFISLTQVNKVISSGEQLNVSGRALTTMKQIVLGGMHSVYIAFLVVIVIIFLINVLDRNKEVVK